MSRKSCIFLLWRIFIIGSHRMAFSVDNLICLFKAYGLNMLCQSQLSSVITRLTSSRRTSASSLPFLIAISRNQEAISGFL